MAAVVRIGAPQPGGARLVPEREVGRVHVGHEEGAVRHAGRSKDVSLYVPLERFSRDDGHEVGERLEADVAVLTLLPWRGDRGRVPEAADPAVEGAVVVLRRVPVIVTHVGHAGGVREQLPHGDRRGAGVLELEVRHGTRIRVVELDPARLHELEDGGGDEGLADRRHVKDGPRRDRLALAVRPLPEALGVEHAGVLPDANCESRRPARLVEGEAARFEGVAQGTVASLGVGGGERHGHPGEHQEGRPEHVDLGRREEVRGTVPRASGLRQRGSPTGLRLTPGRAGVAFGVGIVGIKRRLGLHGSVVARPAPQLLRAHRLATIRIAPWQAGHARGVGLTEPPSTRCTGDSSPRKSQTGWRCDS